MLAQHDRKELQPWQDRRREHVGAVVCSDDGDAAAAASSPCFGQRKISYRLLKKGEEEAVVPSAIVGASRLLLPLVAPSAAGDGRADAIISNTSVCFRRFRGLVDSGSALVGVG
jgi:hypothetical protein